MPAISVIVPIFDVEEYLDECLWSLQAQTVTDLEVILVDDGSRDGSTDIAARYAEEEPRFRLITQPNGGLGRARNVGVDAARGEHLAFLDSDDVLPPDAYARLLDSLRRSGSDFATGNIHRFDSRKRWPAKFLARAFWRDRTATHVSRDPNLLSDRMAQNKLWRRDFWDRHALRFPEGVYHEDIPLVVPAHFQARAVDVLRRPVYLYREREGASRSITQRRTELKVLDDRVDAVEQVDGYLAAEQPALQRRLYAERVLGEDLLYHLDVLPHGDAAYRARFFERATGYLERVAPAPVEHLPPIQRLKWHLVQRGLQDELLEVLAFQRDGFKRNPKRRIGARVYGDYPFLDDPRLAIPREVFRLDSTRRRAHNAATMLGRSS